jgi:hypothetical protein
MSPWANQMVGRPRSRASEAYATVSWWTQAAPEQFTARATREVQRMANSRLANGVDPVHGIKELTTTKRPSRR